MCSSGKAITMKHHKWTEWLKTMGLIVAVITPVSVVAEYVYQHLYKLKCQEVYGVPKNYFHCSIWEFIIFLGAIIFCFWAVYFFRKLFSEDGDEKLVSVVSKAVAVLGAVAYGLAFAFLTMKSIWVIYMAAGQAVRSWMDRYAFFILILSIILCIVTAVSIVCGFFRQNVCQSGGRKVVKIAFIGFIFVMIFVWCCAIFLKLENGPAIKVKYEVLSCDEENYVILSDVSSTKAVAVPYEKDGTGQYTLLTHDYVIVDKTKGKLSFIKMEQPPQIEKEQRKAKKYYIS